MQILFGNVFIRFLWYKKIFHLRGDIEDPLEDMGSVKQLMELFTVISRSDYKTTVEELVRNFEESLSILFRQGVSNQVYFEYIF